MKVETRIPFYGFYCSIFDDELDRCMEMEIYNRYEEDDRLTEQEYSDLLWRAAKHWGLAHNLIASEYPKYLTQWVYDKSGITIDLEFVEMTSPREYNFETDKIFCKIDEDQFKVLVNFVGEDLLEKVIEKNLRSRSGFISFYSEFVREWKTKPLDEWDYNERYMVMLALVEKLDEDHENYGWSIAERMIEDGVFEHAFDNAIDWDFYEQIKAEAIAEKEEEHAD